MHPSGCDRQNSTRHQRVCDRPTSQTVDCLLPGTPWHVAHTGYRLTGFVRGNVWGKHGKIRIYINYMVCLIRLTGYMTWCCRSLDYNIANISGFLKKCIMYYCNCLLTTVYSEKVFSWFKISVFSATVECVCVCVRAPVYIQTNTSSWYWYPRVIDLQFNMLYKCTMYQP